MKKSILIIGLLLFNLINGQEKNGKTDSIIAEFKSEMIRENISDFFMIKHITYVNNFPISKKGDTTACRPKEYYFNMYGFWKNGNDTWIKKYDNCNGFNSIKLTDSKPIEFYKENLESLKKEEVKIYTRKPDSIVNQKTYSFVSSRSHSPQRYFWFYQDSTVFKKNFDKYNLETEEDNVNINYESNMNLSIVKLNLICEEIIISLHEKEKFIKID